MLTLSEFIKYVAPAERVKIYNLDTLEEFSYSQYDCTCPVLDDEDDNWDNYYVIGFYSDYNHSKNDTYIRVNIRRL